MEPDSEAPVRRQCRIKLTEIAEGIDMVSADVAAFLDLEAGEVICLSIEGIRMLERMYESLPASLANATDDEQRAALLAAIKAEDTSITDEEEMLLADAIDRGIDTRYVALPEADTRADYENMQEFVDTVTDARVQSRLDRAIRGRGAFRRFRDELHDTDGELERWYAFKRERLTERASRWLEAEGIDVLADD